MALTPDDLQAIGNLLAANTDGLRKEIQGLRGEMQEMARGLREEIKVEGTRVIEEMTEVITSITQVASEKDAELEKRIDRLEEHTGLAKHN